MVEHQDLVNWLFVVAGSAFGWVLKVLWDAIQGLKKDMKQIERDLPEVYVRKDDFKAAMADMKDDFRELKLDMKEGFSKLDRGLTMVFKKIDDQGRAQHGGND